MAFCSKGHYYDDAQHPTCPSCAGVGAAAGASGAAPKTVYEGDGGPPSGGFAPLRPPAGLGRPLAPPIAAAGGPRTVLDDDAEAVERLMGFLVITATREDEEHRYFRLKRGVNTIGRLGSRATIELRDSEASMEHALVICTNAATRIVDLDSSNGLFVLGDRTEFALLEDGYTIRIGRTELVFASFPYVAED